jgi:hypothetical protein
MGSFLKGVAMVYGLIALGVVVVAMTLVGINERRKAKAEADRLAKR